MCLVKLLGASGPSSSLDHRQPCPFCDCSPFVALSWTSGVVPIQEHPREGAPVQCLPRSQAVADPMHGCHNVLHNISLAAITKELMAVGVPATECARVCAKGLLDKYKADYFTDEKLTQKRITDTLAFFNERRWGRLVESLPEHHLTVAKHPRVCNCSAKHVISSRCLMALLEEFMVRTMLCPIADQCQCMMCHYECCEICFLLKFGNEIESNACPKVGGQFCHRKTMCPKIRSSSFANA